MVDVSDAACIGASHGTSSVCAGGPAADADVNGDGVINILDLTLMGGNYGLASSGWAPCVSGFRSGGQPLLRKEKVL